MHWFPSDFFCVGRHLSFTRSTSPHLVIYYSCAHVCGSPTWRTVLIRYSHGEGYIMFVCMYISTINNELCGKTVSYDYITV